jgi:hypothetical protein
MSKQTFFVVALISLFLAGCGRTEIADKVTSLPTAIPSPIATIKPRESLISMTYQPMQCEKTPWDVWGELGEVALAGSSTPEQLIMAYYASQSISVDDVVKVESGLAICEACSVCPMGYEFTLKTKTENVDNLKATGWEQKS